MSRRGGLLERIRRDGSWGARGAIQGAWSRAVRARDGRCLDCGGTEDLGAHHVEPLADMVKRLGITSVAQAREHAEKLWALTNGVTLCEECHKRADARARGRRVDAPTAEAAE